MSTADITDRIVTFLRGIGVPCTFQPLAGACVLPGIRIAGGGLLIDRERLAHPGDLLHEAGHLAVLPPDARSEASQDGFEREGPSQGDEIGAELWSYLAAKAIGIPPEVVFHDQGYRGSAAWFVEQLESGTLIGLPLLVWMGIADADGTVVAWLRPTEP